MARMSQLQSKATTLLRLFGWTLIIQVVEEVATFARVS